MGAAERDEHTPRHTHTPTHTETSDRGVELGAPNVDLMTGLYEMKQTGEDDSGKKRNRRGGGVVLYYKNGDSVEVRVSFIPVFFHDKPLSCGVVPMTHIQAQEEQGLAHLRTH